MTVNFKYSKELYPKELMETKPNSFTNLLKISRIAKRLASLCQQANVLCMPGYTGDAIANRSALDVGAFLLLKPFTFDSLLAHSPGSIRV